VGETETGEKTNDITSSGLSAAAAPFAPPPPTARRGATNGGAGINRKLRRARATETGVWRSAAPRSRRRASTP
jgi:hypothetical protein